MTHGDEIPGIIRAAIWWNRYGLKGRGAIARLVGRNWAGKEFFISTRNDGLLSVDAHSLDMYASIFNAGGEWNRTS